MSGSLVGKLSGGYGVWKDAQGNTLAETAIMTCCHCNGMVLLHDQHGNERDIELGYCPLCHKSTCPSCASDPRCKPFEQRLRERERRGRLVDAILGG